MTISEFIEKYRLSMTCARVDSNPNMAKSRKGEKAWEADHWLCTIQRDKAPPMTVYFSQGIGHRRWKINPTKYLADWTEHDRKRFGYKPGGRVSTEFTSLKTVWSERLMPELTEPTPPTLESVLDCLASDASLVDSAGSFEAWCGDLGYDSDSRSAEQAYRTIRDQAQSLRAMLGYVGMDELVNHTDRL